MGDEEALQTEHALERRESVIFGEGVCRFVVDVGIAEADFAARNFDVLGAVGKPSSSKVSSSSSMSFTNLPGINGAETQRVPEVRKTSGEPNV